MLAKALASPRPWPPQPITPTDNRWLAPAAWMPPVQAQAAAPAEAAAVCFRNDLRFESVMAGLRYVSETREVPVQVVSGRALAPGSFHAHDGG
jgi:hypothetical protein